MNLSTAQITKLGMALGIAFAVYKFVPNPAVKAAALGVVGTIVAKQIPYVSDALA
jgi:xanthosine utilization system XapX-like protein